jgi:hypothetical protein
MVKKERKNRRRKQRARGGGEEKGEIIRLRQQLQPPTRLSD